MEETENSGDREKPTEDDAELSEEEEEELPILPPEE